MTKQEFIQKAYDLAKAQGRGLDINVTDLEWKRAFVAVNIYNAKLDQAVQRAHAGEKHVDTITTLGWNS